ncbi:MarR family transcriptional regulator [Peribacillus psychrosaccharolyticus]|uniref:MarR family winged helix-turn-helix transcriptional regulator n=1 Tax=Peribacillus psychrosaccharolyticus TaxID=1407 RepID=UPI003D2ADED1
MNSMFSAFKFFNRPYTVRLQQLIAPYHVTEIQWAMVRYLYEMGPATNSDIASDWLVEKPSVTAIAQKLIDQKLIYVVPGVDKRKKVMHLTEEGISIYQQLKGKIDIFHASLLDGVTEEESQIVKSVFTKLHQNIER